MTNDELLVQIGARLEELELMERVYWSAVGCLCSTVGQNSNNNTMVL